MKILDERKTKETKLVEKNVQIDLNNEKHNRKETEQRLVKKVEEKISALRGDVTKEQKKEDEIIERQTKIVVDNVNEIQDTLENERKNRLIL